MSYDMGIGNLTNAGGSKQRLSNLRDEATLSGERLSKGHKSALDIARSQKTGLIYAIDKETKNIESYISAAEGRGTELQIIQSTLEDIRKSSSQISLGILSALHDQSNQAVFMQAEAAEDTLTTIVSSLNRSVAGRSLFSGAKLDSAALVESVQIIDDVEAILNSAPDVTTGLATVDYYFNDPSGGFALSSYTGSAEDSPDVEIMDGRFLRQSIRADNPVIKETIRNVSIIAAVSRGNVTSPSDQASFLKAASEKNLTTNENLVQIQQQVGQDQDVLEKAVIENRVRIDVLNSSRNKVTSVDIFQEAATFEELQVQLETSYRVVVRLSSLTLSNFMR